MRSYEYGILLTCTITNIEFFPQTICYEVLNGVNQGNLLSDKFGIRNILFKFLREQHLTTGHTGN